MSDNHCPKCSNTLSFLAGSPAHPDNRYCDDCGWEAWTERQSTKTFQEANNTCLGIERNVITKDEGNPLKVINMNNLSEKELNMSSPHLNKFEPQRYLTIKREDVEAALSEHDKQVLNNLLLSIGTYREDNGKTPFKNFICVSDSDFNYEIVKNATVNQERLVNPSFHRSVAGRVLTINDENRVLRRNVADLEQFNKNCRESIDSHNKVNVVLTLELKNTAKQLRSQAKHWKANHDNMANRNAELRARPDLKALEMDKLKARINKLVTQVESVYTAGMEGIGLVGKANYQERCDKAEEALNIAMYGEE